MKFVSAIALVFAGGAAFAQDTADNYEMAKLGITMSGHDCARVISAEPTSDDDVVEITCQKSAGSNATVVYIFTIDGAGFSITPK